MNKRIERVGKRLDELGITLVNFRDPVDGSEVPAIDWQQIEILLNKLDDKTNDEFTRGWHLGYDRAVLDERVKPSGW